jgi:hypothetical protein
VFGVLFAITIILVFLYLLFEDLINYIDCKWEDYKVRKIIKENDERNERNEILKQQNLKANATKIEQDFIKSFRDFYKDFSI